MRDELSWHSVAVDVEIGARPYQKMRMNVEENISPEMKRLLSGTFGQTKLYESLGQPLVFR
jgi:hypothetical protein